MLAIERTHKRRRQMNIFSSLVGFISNDPQSMRLDAVSKRVRDYMGEIRYLTIADGNREMRGDLERLRGDFYHTIKIASENDKKSRTKFSNEKN